MTTEEIREVLDRVLTWPPERQADAVAMLRELEAQDDGAFGLSDEQVAEVRRRRSDPHRETITLEEFERFVATLGR